MSRFRAWGVGLLAALALLGTWSQAARAQTGPPVEPLISPEEMLSVDQLHPGMKGYGKSVFQGTKIETFHVTILGVLRKIDFGGDMVLIRIDDGYPVTSGSGVSQGMSGSPIYVGDKIVGALAFAWPFAKDVVAGVTPISQMLDNYRPGSAPLPVQTALTGDLQPRDGPLQLDGRTFSRATVVADAGLAPSRAQAGSTLYLAPVATPVMVSGMGRAGMDVLKRRLGRYGAAAMPGPGEVELPEGERPKIEPGAAVGVTLLGGDMDATAIGTVTYVKGSHVVAFGHPMFGLGTIDLPMTTAYIHGIISSQEVSFKMGAPVETVGHIVQDRNWSIGGRTGETSREVPAEFSVRDQDRGVSRSYRVRSAVHRDLTPMLLYGALLSAVASVSPPDAGTTRGTVEVWPKGMSPIRRENVFAVSGRQSAIEQLFGDPMAGLPLVELLQILETLENNTFGSVPVDRIKVSVEVSEKRRTASIERAYTDRKRVKPGDKVKIGVVIQPLDAPREVRELEVEIPRNIPGGRLQIGVAGGSSAEKIRQFMQITRSPAKTLPQLVAQIADRERNNDLTLETAQPVVGVSVSGKEFPNLPNVVVEVLTGANPSGVRMTRSHLRQTQETPWVLSGGTVLSLQVDADEKDKSGPPLQPGMNATGGFGNLLDFFRVGLGGDSGADFGDDGLEGDDGQGLGAPEARVPGLGRLLGTAASRDDVKLPNDAKMPSFEELQKVLEGDEAAASSVSASPSTPGGRKGLARTPGLWRIASAKDFQGGKLDGVLVSSRGELGLAPPASRLLGSPDRFYWAQAADHAGNVYVGGWLDGSVQKIDPSGQVSRVFNGEGEVAISALVTDSSGTLYAAAEPSGTIYRIAPGAQSAALCRLDNERIWVLQKIGDQLYAGTGSEGRLYRIGPDGKAAVVFSAPDRHVFALAEGPDGSVYCGTYPRGKVFRLHDGKVDPVYELPASTVTALACDAKGNLFIGTSPRASVVRVSPSGDAALLFQSGEKHVFSLLADESGSVYAAVGGQGKVYRIAPDRTVQTLWDPQAAYVLSLARDGAGNVYATTAGPTQIVRLGAKPAEAGTFTSAVLNAGNLSRWGAVRWQGAGTVRVQTRSGNTAYPDATWSGWSDAYTNPAGQPIASPPGQYLQYRVELDGAKSTAAPAVRSLDLFYRNRNRVPELAVKSPAAGQVLSGAKAIRWAAKDPDGDRLQFEVFVAREGTDHWTKIGTKTSGAGGALGEGVDQAAVPLAHPPVALASALRTRVGATRSKITSHPGAVRVSRRQGARTPTAAGPKKKPAVAPEPKVAAEPSEPVAAPEADDTAGDEMGGLSLSWNTKTVPDGRYRVKIVASDSPSSPDDPASGEILSEAVLVDNTAPRAQIQLAKRTGAAPPAEVPVTDAGTYVAAAEYRVDQGEWVAAAAVDGIYDSAEETVRIDPARLKPGRHVLELRLRDAAGNESVSRIPYLLNGVAPR